MSSGRYGQRGRGVFDSSSGRGDRWGSLADGGFSLVVGPCCWLCVSCSRAALPACVAC